MDNLPARNASHSDADGPESNGSFNPSYLDPNPVYNVDAPTAPARNASASDAGGPPNPTAATVHVVHNDKYSEKADPPLVDLKVTNPVTYFKKWVGKLLKNQDIDIRVKIKPFATFALIGAFTAVFGLGYNFGLNRAAQILFPNSSPLLHRAITLEGTVQKSASNKYYLSSGNTLWTLTGATTSLSQLINKDATIKGNLTADKNVINVSEVIPLEAIASKTQSATEGSKISSSLSEGLRADGLSEASPKTGAAEGLPLFSSLQWDTTQAKTLLFTSGKRRIEQEGIYLESASVKDFPQDFINYYNKELVNLGFKQTLNSSEPTGTTVTYAKDETFFTFGTKNVYSGTGDSKTLTGYKAFIEHN